MARLAGKVAVMTGAGRCPVLDRIQPRPDGGMIIDSAR
ncbi:hypothetical protein LC55x_1513 [Lysobacter capsici]|nr:hypothetical protein LC55x_1513 [Lysobacter capsici]